MLRNAAKPKLSLSISTATQPARPSLSLPSPMAARTPLSPRSPAAMSPTTFNTTMNQRGFSSSHLQVPTYSYTNSSSSKSCLKKSSAKSGSKRLQINAQPYVYTITPIENPEDYWVKPASSRDERRWGRGH